MSDGGLPRALGVVGAGTMGAGIAQLGVLAGIDTFLHDAFPEALERGGESVHRGLSRGAERGRWSEDEAAAAERRLVLAGEIGELRDCELVIEAAPERPDLKRELFERLLSPHVPVKNCGKLEVAVREAAADASPGDTVLLSPACASFDQFRDFEDRGDQFRALVGAL